MADEVNSSDSTIYESLDGSFDLRKELTKSFTEAREFDKVTQRRLLHIESVLLDIQFTLGRALQRQASMDEAKNNNEMVQQSKNGTTSKNGAAFPLSKLFSIK